MVLSVTFVSDKFSLGEELDSPLFYIVPVIECSDSELPTLYNIAVPNKGSKRYCYTCTVIVEPLYNGNFLDPGPFFTLL